MKRAYFSKHTTYPDLPGNAYENSCAGYSDKSKQAIRPFKNKIVLMKRAIIKLPHAGESKIGVANDYMASSI